MKIKWLDHACFLVEDSVGIKVIADPYESNPKQFAGGGFQFDYPPIDGVQADIVLISHEHLDHNAFGVVGGSPTVIREQGDFEVSGIPVRAIAGEHDPEGGKKRGPNLIVRWEMDGISLCHFGDYGQYELRPEQIEALGRVDILFVPVGGDQQKGPTIDAAGAKRIVEILDPRMIFPMHYATPAVNFLQPVEHFLRLMSPIEERRSSVIEVRPEDVLSMTPKVIVLQSPSASK